MGRIFVGSENPNNIPNYIIDAHMEYFLKYDIWPNKLKNGFKINNNNKVIANDPSEIVKPKKRRRK